MNTQTNTMIKNDLIFPRMGQSNPSEKILWSIALPGFAQFLNGKLFKLTTIQLTNYQWRMFYPCIYLFALWDAYRDAGGGSGSFSYLPFVFSAFLGTIGVIYSSTFKLFGILWGPIFLPILFLIIEKLAVKYFS